MLIAPKKNTFGYFRKMPLVPLKLLREAEAETCAEDIGVMVPLQYEADKDGRARYRAARTYSGVDVFEFTPMGER